jgi:hypothetical protein
MKEKRVLEARLDLRDLKGLEVNWEKKEIEVLLVLLDQMVLMELLVKVEKSEKLVLLVQKVLRAKWVVEGHEDL